MAISINGGSPSTIAEAEARQKENYRSQARQRASLGLPLDVELMAFKADYDAIINANKKSEKKVEKKAELEEQKESK